MPPLADDYLKVIDKIQCHLRPRRYIEIGVQTGVSLSLALPGTRCIGIDPEFQFKHRLPQDVVLFNETSDDFFRETNVDEVLGGPADLAFIDGMHLFEFALRDIHNIERNSHPGAVLLLHDCKPIDEQSASRTRTTRDWTGDVWRAIVALTLYRPDLHVHTVDVSPSGLAVITGLNPGDTILATAYDDIVARVGSIPYASLGREYHLNLCSGDWSSVRALLPAPFRPQQRPMMLRARRDARRFLSREEAVRLRQNFKRRLRKSLQ